MILVGIVGASGRTGRHVVEALAGHSDCALEAAVVSPSSRHRGLRVPGAQTEYTSSLEALDKCNVVIDFSTPRTSCEVVERCSRRAIPVLVATTGHSEVEMVAIRDCSGRIPVGIAPNTSIGAAALSSLVEHAKRFLGEGFDIEVMEIHHRMKKDSPSGTARSIIQGIEKDRSVVFGREGERKVGEIGVVSLRGGDVAGDHTVYFLGHGERIELSHRVSTRDVFGIGAVRLAVKLIGRQAGLYSARDLLEW